LSRALLAWSCYDLANTLVYAVVMTRYFTPQIERLTGSRTLLWVGFVFASILAGLISPVAGTAAETSGRLRRDFVVSSLLCGLAAAAMGLTQAPVLLVALYVATFVAYQTSLVYYNAMLVDVARPGRVGFASGLGTAVGYIGGPIGIAGASVMRGSFGFDEGGIYLATAAAFLLFSLPSFLWVRPVRVRQGRVDPVREWRRAVSACREALSHRPTRNFYLGNFFCSDALNTALICIADFTLNGLRFTQGETDGLLIAANLLALPVGLVLGGMADRRGARGPYVLAAGSLLAAVILPQFPMPRLLQIAALAVPGAIGMGGIALAGRKWLVDLCAGRPLEGPFGIYGLTNKFSIVGVILYSVLADAFGTPRAGVLVPAAMLVVGIAFLRRVPSRAGRGEEAEGAEVRPTARPRG
jgi:UMF1 family MFS transporter